MKFSRNNVERLIKGDEKAFELLVHTFSKKLFAYAISLSGDYSLSKDIVQEVFISTFEFRKRLDPNYSIESFLYRSVYNNYLNKYSQQKSFKALKEKYILTLNQLMSEASQNEDFEKNIKEISHAIDQLPKKCKEIFILSKKNGLTNIEIAEYLGISIKTVENQITLAFSKIKKQLKGE